MCSRVSTFRFTRADALSLLTLWACDSESEKQKGREPHTLAVALQQSNNRGINFYCY
jgi:hypothetical protein